MRNLAALFRCTCSRCHSRTVSPRKLCPSLVAPRFFCLVWPLVCTAMASPSFQVGSTAGGLWSRSTCGGRGSRILAARWAWLAMPPRKFKSFVSELGLYLSLAVVALCRADSASRLGLLFAMCRISRLCIAPSVLYRLTVVICL